MLAAGRECNDGDDVSEMDILEDDTQMWWRLHDWLMMEKQKLDAQNGGINEAQFASYLFCENKPCVAKSSLRSWGRYRDRTNVSTKLLGDCSALSNSVRFKSDRNNAAERA
ncbi:MAG TPA: hypothetical protein VGK48_18765 [Terriglobia bacterium]|jgi:hypothetical protein